MEKSFEKRDLTKKSENVSDWYNDVVLRAGLCDYTDVKGSIIIKPYAYAIWEKIQKEFDKMFKEDGIKNCYFPMLIPMSLIQKEKEHVEGFAPELLTVDRIGDEKLEDPLVLRPTSETIMYKAFSNWVQGYRDLPIKINQWCNIFRAEKRTIPFLRTREFLWQEGHCAFSNNEDNLSMVFKALDWYKDMYEKYLGISVYVGVKSQSEKFAGAKNTYTVEVLCPNGKALQGCTSHDLADNFSKAFDISFLNEKSEKNYAFQSSFGFTTRSIGSLVLVHGDDSGLIIPPMIAPIQVVIIPINKKNQENVGIIDCVNAVEKKLKEIGIRTFVDNDDVHSLGYKINNWELKGVPIRIEIGASEVENGKIKVVRRDDFSKEEISLNGLENEIKNILEKIQDNLFKKSQELKIEKTKEVEDYTSFKKTIEEGNFARIYFCEDEECEKKIKEETQATARCLEFDQMTDDGKEGKCACCGKISKHKWLFGKSY